MQQMRFSRRSFVRNVSSFAVACTVCGNTAAEAQQTMRVPWSSGVESPNSNAPVNATDCHHHVYDSRFPMDPTTQLRPGNATVSDYRLLQKLLGTTRNVIVQPSTYGVDNRCLLDALHQFGRVRTRGIAVVNTKVLDAELKELDAAGICGIRFNLVQAGATTFEMIEPLAKRVAPLGWHLQVNATANQILDMASIWHRLPVPVVFDHMGHVASPKEPAFGLIAHLLQNGKCWVKLSGAYMDTNVGAPTYSDRSAVAMAFIKEAPERLVWGTDWPHPTTNDKPDDALLFDLLVQWSNDEKVRTRILVHNPAHLYGFS
jgi:predicted TIM-barrel fold metal-dependent hydrolase